jgi:hypothetical protein
VFATIVKLFETQQIRNLLKHNRIKKERKKENISFFKVWTLILLKMTKNQGCGSVTTRLAITTTTTTMDNNVTFWICPKNYFACLVRR